MRKRQKGRKGATDKEFKKNRVCRAQLLSTNEEYSMIRLAASIKELNVAEYASKAVIEHARQTIATFKRSK